MENFVYIRTENRTLKWPVALDSKENRYFCGKSLCKFLDYHNIPQALHNNVAKQNKKRLDEILTDDAVFYHDEKSVYLDTDGVKQMLQKTKNGSLNVIKTISEALNLDLNLIIPSKEKNTLECIIRAFPAVSFETQYRVEKFRIDMYCKEFNIAIECDEFNHKNRDKNYETQRQAKIIEILGCDVVRYDPDSKNFDVLDVVGKISTLILSKLKTGTAMLNNKNL